MEKRISYTQFQSVKNVAKAVEPIMRKIRPIEEKIKALQEEIVGYQKMIEALEAGIVSMTGFHVDELVKKEVTVTGTDQKTGKPIKSVKFLPTDIVKYDEAKKQYVVCIPDEEPKTNAAEEPLRVPVESNYGSDYDLDKEHIQQEAQHDFLEPTSMDIFD